MPLRLRLTLAFAAVALTLVATFCAVGVFWQRAQQARFDAALLGLQRTGWLSIEGAVLRRLQAQAEAMAAAGPLADTLARDDVDAQPTALQASDGNRLDAFDAHGRILYTTSLALAQETPMLDIAAVRRVLAGGRVAGLMPVVGGGFSFVVAVPVRVDGRVVGGMTLGSPVGAALDELSGNIGAPVALVNLRGGAVAGNGRPAFDRLEPDVSLRSESLVPADSDGRAWQVASVPIAGWDGRLVGGVASLRDVTAARDQARLLLAAASAGAALFVAAALGALWLHLRRSFAPLARAVDVLTALSRGDTSVRVDAEHLDEAGRIADGVERLRGEMINLEVLREERRREMRRQERVIRDEMRALAGTLDTQARREVLLDLQAALAGRATEEGGGHRLATIARVLRGLSQRIRGQQQRLLQLLDDLNEALRTKAAFVALQQELDIARRMQLSILPRVFPQRPDVSLSSLILPAQEVGGDFYDWFLLDDDRLGVVVADVSGKGVPAAFFMAIARTLLKANSRYARSPAEALAHANQSLAAENEEMMFVTLFYGVLQLSTGRFTYASGGHNPPVLRSADGHVRLLPRPRGMALAVDPDAPFAEGELRLAPGDTLFLYTDGVTEALDAHGRLFGDAAMLATLAALPQDAPAEVYPRQVVAALEAFAGEEPQADDITCVALRYDGQPVAVAARPLLALA